VSKQEKEKTRKRKISVEKVRAIVHATIDNPRVMKELANLNPGLARKVFEILPEIRPQVGMDVMYRVVLGLESAEALHRLVDQAILGLKADDLWCVVVRLAKQWVKNDYIPEWDHYGNASREIMRLMLHVGFEYQEEMILALNPYNELWFHHTADFDKLWSRIVQHEVELGKWDEAFKSLVMAGRGIPVKRKIPSKLESEADKIQEIRDYESNDFLGWETYGRAPNFEELVEFLWGAHVSAGMLPPKCNRLFIGHPIRVAQNESTGERLSGLMSINGLLARGATGLKFEALLYQGQIHGRPLLDSVALSPCMAKFQELALYYNRRRAQFLRPIASANALPC
jgi:hypothetical protein